MCYNCGKRCHPQIDFLENKIQREERECTNWKNNAQEQRIVSTLSKTNGNVIVNGFPEGKGTSFTNDTGSTESTMRPT